jgi:hypothetical protein
VQRANALLCEFTDNAALATIDGAAHFAIATHAVEIASRIAAHVHRAKAELNITCVRFAHIEGPLRARSGHSGRSKFYRIRPTAKVLQITLSFGQLTPFATKPYQLNN